MPTALDEAGIDGVVAAFEAATRRALAAGFGAEASLAHLVRLRGQAAGAVGRPFDKLPHPSAPSRPPVPGVHTLKRTLVLSLVVTTTATLAAESPLATD